MIETIKIMVIIGIFFILLSIGLIWLTTKQRFDWYSAQAHKFKGWVFGLGSIALGIRILLDVIFDI